jgi:hypothetical protein
MSNRDSGIYRIADPKSWIDLSEHVLEADQLESWCASIIITAPFFVLFLTVVL